MRDYIGLLVLCLLGAVLGWAMKKVYEANARRAKEFVIFKIMGHLLQYVFTAFTIIAVDLNVMKLLSSIFGNSIFLERLTDIFTCEVLGLAVAYAFLRHRLNFALLSCVTGFVVWYAVGKALSINLMLPDPYLGIPLFLTIFVFSLIFSLLIYTNIHNGNILAEKFRAWKAGMAATAGVGTLGLLCSTLSNVVSNKALNLDETFNVILAILLAAIYPFYLSLLITDFLLEVNLASFKQRITATISKIPGLKCNKPLF